MAESSSPPRTAASIGASRTRAGAGTSYFSVRFADATHGLVVGAFGA
ncbi:MAG: hypothetical protein U1F11_15615 [Steroidobacteraceae bacterium]